MTKHKKKVRHTKVSHRSPKKTYSFFQSKIFYFLGFVVIVAIAAYQSGLFGSFQANVLGDASPTPGDEQGTEQFQQQGAPGFQGQAISGGTPAAPQQFQINQQQGESEIQGPNGTVKTKVEDNGGIQVEGAKPGFQFKLEDQNGQSEIQVEDTKGNALPQESQDALEKELEDKQGVRISSEDGKFALDKGDVRAVSDFPFAVDTTKQQIMITTPNGRSVPVILPNVAIENLSRVGVLTSGSGSGQLTGTPSSSLSLTTNANGIPVYYVPGFKDKNFLGVFPVQVPVTGEVSAQTGTVINQQQTLLSQLLDFLSF